MRGSKLTPPRENISQFPLRSCFPDGRQLDDDVSISKRCTYETLIDFISDSQTVRLRKIFRREWRRHSEWGNPRGIVPH